MPYANLLHTYLYLGTGNFHFIVSEEVCIHTKAYTQNKTLLVLKAPLDSSFVLLLQTNTNTPLNLCF